MHRLEMSIFTSFSDPEELVCIPADDTATKSAPAPFNDATNGLG